jgi:hypothetical protein
LHHEFSVIYTNSWPSYLISVIGKYLLHLHVSLDPNDSGFRTVEIKYQCNGYRYIRIRGAWLLSMEFELGSEETNGILFGKCHYLKLNKSIIQ